MADDPKEADYGYCKYSKADLIIGKENPIDWKHPSWEKRNRITFISDKRRRSEASGYIFTLYAEWEDDYALR